MNILLILFLYLVAVQAETPMMEHSPYPLQGGWLAKVEDSIPLASYGRHFVGEIPPIEYDVIIYEIYYPAESKKSSFYVDHCLAHELTRNPTKEELDNFKLLSADQQKTFFSLRMGSSQYNKQKQEQAVFSLKFNKNTCLLTGLFKHIPPNGEKENSVHVHIAQYQRAKELMPSINSIIKDSHGLKTFLILIPRSIGLDIKKEAKNIELIGVYKNIEK